ncbi:Ribonuclease H domain - like 10 [Theobroma cacao]|nr:Ribonuclease H domain - like 10 [Theobroma cacao]
MCYALAWIAQRLRQCMLYHTTWLVSKLDPIKYIFEKPFLFGRIARWQVLLSKYDIVYVSQKLIKGSVITDFLTNRAAEDYEPVSFDFSYEDLMAILHIEKDGPNELNLWKMYFDGESIALGHEIGAVLISPYGKHYPATARLNFNCTNNMTEYEALVMGLQVVIDMKADMIEVYADSALVICQMRVEANKIIEEVHEGSCGAHASGHILARQIMRVGYYWLTLEADCINFARKCHKCQIYADKIHAPPSPLHIFMAPWPFSIWAMDVIGLITPKASNGHQFILVVIDYFTKWVEAASYANVTQKVIKYHNSTTYRPKMNGAVEAANKNIKRIIEKMTQVYKDWHEKLPFALHAFRTSVRTSTGATPYSLVYGTEVVLPVEVEIPSLRVLMETKLEEAEWVRFRQEQLNLIEEKRLAALCHG